MERERPEELSWTIGKDGVSSFLLWQKKAEQPMVSGSRYYNVNKLTRIWT